MKKSEFINLFADLADDAEIDETLAGTELVKDFINKGLTLDAFKSKLKEKDFKAFLEGEGGKDFEKRLKEWKKANLEKELEPFIQEKYPDLVTDPTQKKILELEKKLADEQKANARKDLITEAIKYANEKKIPSNLVENFLGEDLEKTKENLDGFIETINPWISNQVDERLGASSWVPGGAGSAGASKSLGAQLAEELNNSGKAEGPNPWA
ncbi:DUF4355 domain-containing protein [Clostridium perfringens]|uniref:DUF4355 domain-containing protein n=1 Tax=Clostridium perfringens TaxID=1502 RepID=UPI0028E148E4|nr:DUF4355 domain-containing protein [Clostridium perfringens]MDT9337756.1 DUF4355 domain-containing protein [Clostridium perfringens]MDT9345513.1 DUF4355 domain-containing protein [Clostridium perfringens]MDT9348756.1 DUF4355 domain-containing protein [Clostridium perfringens]MDT9354642.1 DUF4355 domain-containing protein [Clostridium perfringens]